MTVEELIAELQKLPQDWKVLVYDYGNSMEVSSVYVYDEGEVVIDIC